MKLPLRTITAMAKRITSPRSLFLVDAFIGYTFLQRFPSLSNYSELSEEFSSDREALLYLR
jgi:hypothetical protein